jgi:hypothetical protein
MREETKAMPDGTYTELEWLGDRFQAFFHYKTPPVVGVISLEGG